MKKLLVLLMVLGLVSSANAALSISLSDTTVLVGNTVTLSVSSDDGAFWDGFLILSEDTVNWTDPVAADYSGSMTLSGVGNLGWATPDGTYPAVYALNVASNLVPSDVVAGTQFSIDIIGVQMGTIYVGLQNGSYEPVVSDLTLEVVPEPMTIALLGLGGLFLRRRK